MTKEEKVVRTMLEKLAYGVDCSSYYNREHVESCIDCSLKELMTLIERIDSAGRC